MLHSQPVPEELQNGESFGYIIAFRAFGDVSWTHVATSVPGAARYVYRNDSIAPFSPFHVKVGTYNIKGQGPFSPVATIYSAETGTASSRGLAGSPVAASTSSMGLARSTAAASTSLSVIAESYRAVNARFNLLAKS